MVTCPSVSGKQKQARRPSKARLLCDTLDHKSSQRCHMHIILNINVHVLEAKHKEKAVSTDRRRTDNSYTL